MGLPLAEALVQRRYSVKGSTRTQAKLPKLQAAGIEPYYLELGPPITGDIEGLLAADMLILDVPPNTRGGGDDGRAFLEQMEALLPRVADSPVNWVLMVSSTGVYPNLNRTVREGDEPPADAPDAHRLLAAEQRFRNSEAFDTTILRLGGLIGPSRHPARYFAGRTDLANGNAPVNLIHLADVIGLVLRIIEADARGAVYNGVAPEHPARGTYYPAAAEALGYERPVFREELGAWKQVSGEKAQQELGYRYRVGLDPARTEELPELQDPD